MFFLFKNIDLFKEIKDYGDVCWALGVEVLTINDFNFLPKEQRLKTLSFHKIQNICTLFNEDWILNWDDSKQQKWFPYHQKQASGWVFDASYYRYDFSVAAAGFYKDEKTSDHCGKLFLDVYNDFNN